MLKLNELSISFDGITVWENLSSPQVLPGDVVMVLGPNGTGKSTLFDVISGRVRPQRGTVILDGIDISSWSEARRAPLISRVFQNPHLGSVPSLTVAENLALANTKGRRSSMINTGLRSFPSWLIDEVLKPLNLNLENLLHKPMGSLSGGQRQILSFIMATLKEPKILLLDEPTAALDPRSSEILMDFAFTWIAKKQFTTFMITHHPQIAMQYGKRIWNLQNGTLLESKMM